MTDAAFAHAWVLPHEIDDAAWIVLRHDATRVLRAVSARLEAGRPDDVAGVLRGPDGLGPPVVTQHRIAFNGSAFRGAAGDAFVLERVAASGVVVRAGAGTVGRAVHRCDTRGQPYDLAVCALLLTAQLHLRDAMRLGSSGGLAAGWQAAAGVVRAAIAHEGHLLQSERGLIAWSAPAQAQHTRERRARTSA
jgi:hypothetical protein